MDFLYELDKGLLLQINRHWANSWFDVFFPAITDLHKNPWALLIIVGFFLTLFVKRFGRYGIGLFLILLLALGTTDLIGNRAFKKTVARSRPGDALSSVVIVRSPYGGYSFTSNHAANMFCLAKYVSELVPGARVLTYSFAALVSYSRVYNGVHYPSDVAGGGLLGWLIGWLYSLAGKEFFNRIRKQRVIK